MQYRYKDDAGQWHGGLTVSDPLGQKHGGHLLHRSCDPVCTP
jgi:hypothetical protein